MPNTFAVFLTVKPESEEKHRMVFANKLANKPDSFQCDILDAVILPFNHEMSAVLIVSAIDQNVLISELEKIAEIYSSSFASVEVTHHNPDIGEVDMCVLSSNPIEKNDLPHGLADLQTRLSCKVTGHDSVDYIWFTHGSDAVSVIANFEHQTGYTGFPNGGFSPLAFLDKQQGKVAPLPTPEAAEVLDSPPITLKNTGTKPFWGSSFGVPTADYAQAQATKFKFVPGRAYRVGTPILLWKDQPGTYTYLAVFDSGSTNSPIKTTFATPTVRLQPQANSQVDVNLDKDISITNRTDIEKFFYDLINTNDSSLPWPEDNYDPPHEAAYNYILKNFLDGIPPRNGTLKAGDFDKIKYPVGGNPNFSEPVFMNVKNHLIDVYDFLEYVNDWYGSNGVFASMNSNIIKTATLALISAQDRMSIPEQNTVEMILKMIFSDILGAVGAIDGVGPALYGVLNIIINAADLAIDINNEPKSINGVVADLANDVVKTMQILVNTVAEQEAAIKKDWGKTQALAEAIRHGKISEAMLDATGRSENSDGVAKMGEGYIEAAKTGWEITFYKALYYIKYNPKAFINISGSSSGPNRWNPKAGSYVHTFDLPATVQDSSNNRSKAILNVSYQPNGSSAVQKRLFDPDQLAVDPIDFFMGLGGWKYIKPLHLVSSVGGKIIISIP